jgi:hypothetical protein
MLMFRLLPKNRSPKQIQISTSALSLSFSLLYALCPFYPAATPLGPLPTDNNIPLNLATKAEIHLPRWVMAGTCQKYWHPEQTECATPALLAWQPDRPAYTAFGHFSETF